MWTGSRAIRLRRRGTLGDSKAAIACRESGITQAERAARQSYATLIVAKDWAVVVSRTRIPHARVGVIALVASHVLLGADVLRACARIKSARSRFDDASTSNGADGERTIKKELHNGPGPSIRRPLDNSPDGVHAHPRFKRMRADRRFIRIIPLMYRKPMRWPHRALVLTLSLVAPSAAAYTVETPITNGCHELITEAALRSARAVTPAAAPLPLETEDDQALASDLPFSTASDMGDLGAISLLLGVRDNDMKGLLPTDFAGFAIVQGDPTTQDEHCLRSLSDVEPNGTPESLAACKAYILGRVAAALAYLTPGGNPDPDARLGLTVGLSFRGSVSVPLPGFYVCMGQALHALEDGFSHSYREPDAGAVTASLTWLHILDNDLDPAVDGPPHTSVLDECTSLDALRTVRLARAEDASKELLLAALGPGTTEHRLANAGAVLDEFLAYKPGCTAKNHWCNAPEAAYPLEADGCSVHAHTPARGGAAGAGFFVALGLVAARRRRRTSACVGALLATTASPAFAIDTPNATAPCAAPEPVTSTPRLGAYLAVGGSLDNTAMNVSLAGRYRLSPGWLVGVDGEFNPWFSINADGARPGALNFFATLIRRWPPWSGTFGLRSSLHLGSSTILFDLFGVPKYTTGIYIGANLLGAEWKIGHALSVVVDPADVAFPVPQLAGTPFGYLQYRITLGLQWGA